MKRKTKQILFLAIALSMMILPAAALPFAKEEVSTENRTLAAMPKLAEEGKFNPRFLPEAGEWFEDHFAFRNALVNMQSLLLGGLFQTSSNDQVIQGKDGWLYYAGTMDDYTGESLLSKREVFNIVHNLQLINHYITSKGSRLIVCFAPNKNSIYQEHMPARYQKAEDSNLQQVQAALKQAGIACIDLLDPLLQNKGQDLYFKQDSHWNHRGALLAYNTLMEQMGIDHETYEEMIPIEEEALDDGDLAKMLYPLTAQKEEDIFYPDLWTYTWKQGDEDLMAELIETTSPSDNGTLLMFRDSFAMSLLPYLSSTYSHSLYDRVTPYNLIRIEALGPCDVIIERTERRIASLQKEAAVMRMPVIANPDNIMIPDAWQEDPDDPGSKPSNTGNSRTDSSKSAHAAIEAKSDGDFLCVTGHAARALEPDVHLYVQMETKEGKVYTFPTFYIEEEGCAVFLEKKAADNQECRLSLLQEENGVVTLLSQTTWKPE